jgi:hypothetical protein
MVTKSGEKVPIAITKKWERKKIGSCFWMEASIVDDLVKSHEFNIKQHQNHRYQAQARLSTSALAPKFTLVSSNYRPRYLPYIDDRRL